VPAPTTDLFEFEDVSVVAGGRRILEGVTATIPVCRVAVVAGASGAGKSTLLRLCNRLAVPTAGRIRYRGDDVAALDPLALRRRVGMVFQRPAVFPGTVRDNLLVARPDLDDRGATATLDRVHLESRFLDRPTVGLSGGEAQRVCLARTLVAEPEVVLMDEPTSSLDEAATRALEGLARELGEAGTTVVWVTHDLGQLRRVAEHLLVLHEGTVVASGDPGQVAEVDHPAVRALRLADESGNEGDQV
jgi:putative ABC transport system ATP-binding protein